MTIEREELGAIGSAYVKQLTRERDEARAELAKLQAEFAELKAYDEIREADYDAGSNESYRLGYARAFEKVANARAVALEEAAREITNDGERRFGGWHPGMVQAVRDLASLPPTMACVERAKLEEVVRHVSNARDWGVTRDRALTILDAMLKVTP